MTTGEAWLVTGGAALTLAITAAVLFWIQQELKDRARQAGRGRPPVVARPLGGLHVDDRGTD